MKVLQNEIDYSPIKSQDAISLLKKILVKDPEKRAGLLDLASDNWVTNNGKEIINIKNIEYQNT